MLGHSILHRPRRPHGRTTACDNTLHAWSTIGGGTVDNLKSDWMKLRWISLMALLAILIAVVARGPNATPAPAVISEPTPAPSSVQPAAFTYADPQSQGLSEQALQQLADEVQGYFDDGLIVGAELVVIKNRRVVLHQAIGWKDREDQVPMERNTLFNIRSMTKPVLGTITQTLIDEGKLALDDPVAKYLPSFDNAKSDAITIRHLLTHRSGLPLSLLANWPNYASLQDIATEAGEHGPDFAPGTRFQYSDTGSDTLGAVLEVVSGVALGDLYRERVLEPLGMSDTVTMIDADDPRTERIASAYLGTRNNWSRYWSPADGPLYPFSMGSQSLYCTPLDYARFLALWMDGGQVGEQRLLSAEAVQRAMVPVSTMKQLGADADYPTEFPGLDVWYGQFWMLYVDPNAPEGAPPLAFGHGGSDGTAAWVWPDRDLIVLYFTQSRGGATVIRFEEVLDCLLINPGPGEEAAQLPEEWQPYLGTFTGRTGVLRNQQYTVVARDGHLAVDIPEGLLVDLQEAEQEGKWFFTIDPSVTVSFEHDEGGNVMAMSLHLPDETFVLPRGEAPPEPALDIAAVQKYVGFYLAEEDQQVEILIHDGRLAVKAPQAGAPLELYPPDEQGRWSFRLNPAIAISFQESADGEVLSFTAHMAEGDFVRPRVKE
jgi:CubicO group peptidase (beta-lactamase class C family)